MLPLPLSVKIVPLKNKNVTDMDSLQAEAQKAMPGFNALMKEFQGEVGGELVTRPEPKSAQSIENKKKDYDGDYGRVNDVLGGTLLFNSEQEVLEAFEKLKNDGRIVRIKDRWNNPTDLGNRDILLNVRLPNGYIAELQLHHKGIFEAKEAIGHDLYKLHDALHKSGQFALRDGVKKLSQEIYGLAYELNGFDLATLSASSRETCRAILYHLDNVSKDILSKDALGRIRKAFAPIPSSDGAQSPLSSSSTANTKSSSPSMKYSNLGTPATSSLMGSEMMEKNLPI